jgi:formate-dependent nitrite reductase membrane component NrfD
VTALIEQAKNSFSLYVGVGIFVTLLAVYVYRPEDPNILEMLKACFYALLGAFALTPRK